MARHLMTLAFVLAVVVVWATIAPDQASYYNRPTDWRSGFIEVHDANWPVEIRQWVE